MHPALRLVLPVGLASTALMGPVAHVVAAAPVSASAVAAARGCDPGGERTPVTWVQVLADPDGGTYTPDAHLVSGLAGSSADGADTSLRVVVHQRGRARVATLCSGGDRIAELARLRREESVGSASVNGHRVAWRTYRPSASAPGRVRTATVRSGRVRAVHTFSVPFLGPDAVTAAIHLLPSGTLAWQVSGRAWVWPIGRRPVRVPSTPAPAARAGNSIRILDDRNVLVNGRVRGYREARPGSCPPVVGAASVEHVGGWRVSRIDDGRTESDYGFSSTSSAVICDPASGRYIAADSGDGETGTYVGDPGGSSFTAYNRSGDWLIRTRSQTDGGGYAGASIEGHDLVTGARFRSSGDVEVDGREHPLEGSPATGSSYGPRWTTGVTVGPGMVAWCSSDPAADGVWLSDANGTRRVGDATPTPTSGDPALSSCGLRQRDGTLEWGPPDDARRVVISPAANRAFG